MADASTAGAAHTGPDPRHVVFVTGRLAEPALRRVLADMTTPFTSDVAVLGITVAALMTTTWIADHLEVPADTDLVLIPGLCEGDPQAAPFFAVAKSVVERLEEAAAQKGPTFSISD